MHLCLGLIPFSHPWTNGNHLNRSRIPIFNAQGIAADDNRNAPAPIGVPGQGFAWLQDVSPDADLFALTDDFYFHSLSLGSCLQHHVDRRLRGSTEMAEATVGHDLAQLRLASLSTEGEANFLA